MSILVTCPNPPCGKVHKVKNKYAGKRCHCPDCHTVMSVPESSAPLDSTVSAPSLSWAAAPAAPPAIAAEPLPLSLDKTIPEFSLDDVAPGSKTAEETLFESPQPGRQRQAQAAPATEEKDDFEAFAALAEDDDEIFLGSIVQEDEAGAEADVLADLEDVEDLAEMEVEELQEEPKPRKGKK